MSVRYKMKKKTTIIVGAGASKEVGLPTGCELKKVIAEMLDYEFDPIIT